MSARFEIVQTDAEQPWHARIVGANGEIVWTTENYARRIDAAKAIGLALAISNPAVPGSGEIRSVDERGTGQRKAES